MAKETWKILGIFGLLVVYGSSMALAQSRKKSSALGSSKTSEIVQVKLTLDGRLSFNQTQKVPVAWEDYDAIRINIANDPDIETPAYAFDYRGDEFKIDFRNEDFVKSESLGLGNIANPRPVTDLEAALDRARRDILMQYRIWIEDRKEPIGIILTPWLIRVIRDSNRIVVKMTQGALNERDAPTTGDD